MSIKKYINIIGLEHAGGFFAKELARYVATGARTDMEIVLCDQNDVTEDDPYQSVFLPSDIGWNRAAVLSGALQQTYEKLNITGVARPFESYDVHSWHNIQGRNGYQDNTEIDLIFDFSGTKETHRAVKKYWKGEKSVIAVIQGSNYLQIAVRLGNIIVKPYVNVKPLRQKQQMLSESLQISRVCLALCTQIFDADKVVNTDNIQYGAFDVMQREAVIESVRNSSIRIGQKQDSWLCVCVGTGGTGGNFVKELPHLLLKKKEISLLMMDGDRVEEKNMARQPFASRDLLQNKADILCRDLLADYPELEGRIFSWPKYLDQVSDLTEAISKAGKYDHVLLVGGVDNHAARRVMEEYHNSCDSSVYVDAANEWSEGQVTISVRQNGQELSPVRSFYFPDVLTDHTPSASEISCGAVNESSPQHICTNLCSAQNVLSAVEPLLLNGTICAGIVFFDTFRQFSRFQKVETKELESAS